MARAKKSAPATWSSEGPLVISKLHALKPGLLEAIERAGSAGLPVEIDLGSSTQADTAGVQFLLAARNEAARRGTSLRILRMAAPVAASVRRLGLTQQLHPE